jgi:hypothetical protein
MSYSLRLLLEISFLRYVVCVFVFETGTRGQGIGRRKENFMLAFCLVSLVNEPFYVSEPASIFPVFVEVYK